MKFPLNRVFLLFILSLVAFNGKSQNIFFADESENSFSKTLKRAIVPVKYRTLKLNKPGLLNFLKSLPTEVKALNRNNNPIIELPLPEGGTAKFRIWESAVMDPALAAKYPEIKTYTGQGIDDPTANIKLDFTPAGFHAMIISSLKGAVFIDPYSRGNSTEYISYNKGDYTKPDKYFESTVMRFPGNLNRPASPSTVLAGTCIGSQLRTYRLALAANGEYTAFHGGTVVLALAAQVTTMNRVNGIYERELAIRMVLVANNDLLIYTNTESDPYDNDNENNIMLSQNQTTIDAVILNANYDIGHVFSTGGGGVAGLGIVCFDGQKAKGVTGNSSPTGDPFDVDYVCHEMGHQFGANHTFNSTSGSCSGNGTLFTNTEPGSGSSVMAYAGICGGDNLQNTSDAQFHAISFNEITQYSMFGTGNNCAVISSTGNAPPVVNAGPNYIIPKSTPFSLTGSATDANGDALTFSWEQIDVGGPNGTWDNPSGNAPLFRSFVPKSTPVRYFPNLSDLANNNINGNKGEVLPGYARTMNFRLTARDNRAGGGGVCFDETSITVSGTTGPFLISYPNVAGITWYVNDFKTITWDPSGTAAAPVNCTNVKVELSTDGGNTYPIVLAASTPNDGSEDIQVPNNVTSAARVRVTAVGNVFFDISNANFSIQNSPTPEFVFNNPSPVVVCGGNSGLANLKTGALAGFSTPISLSATGNPGGTSVTFGTNPLSPGSTTTVTLNNTNTLASGIYTISVNGVAGAVNKSRDIVFQVGTSSPGAPSNLTAPANNAIGISTQPSFNWSPVAGAISYTLEISTSASFTPLLQSQANITTLPYSLVTPLTENTVYYWRVRTINSCGTGDPSGTGIFKTGLNPCKNSSDAPKLITDTDSISVFSTIVIPAQSGVTITDINVVGLTGSHAYVGDLTVSLTSPGGKTVLLFDQVCPGFENFNVTLDDEAASAISCPITGNQISQPQKPLSVFDGDNSAGTWILTVKDNYAQDGGSLTGWGLAINNCAFVATPLPSTPWTQLCPPSAGTSLTSNLSGTAYQWQVNTGSGFNNISNNSNYNGTNTGTLQITNAPSAWNGYQYRCVVDGNNSTVFTLGFTSYWNGSVSTAWENPSNWSCNAVPDSNTDVIINSGNVIVNSMGICRSIRANTGASVTVNTGFKITVSH